MPVWLQATLFLDERLKAAVSNIMVGFQLKLSSSWSLAGVSCSPLNSRHYHQIYKCTRCYNCSPPPCYNATMLHVPLQRQISTFEENLSSFSGGRICPLNKTAEDEGKVSMRWKLILTMWRAHMLQLRRNCIFVFVWPEIQLIN